MNRVERRRAAALARALERRDAAIAAADARAMYDLERAGFRFRSVMDALVMRSANADAARAEAARVSRLYEHTRRTG